MPDRAAGIGLREAPAVLLGCGRRRCEAALALGRVERRCVARGLRLARLQRHALGRGHRVARPAPSRQTEALVSGSALRRSCRPSARWRSRRQTTRSLAPERAGIGLQSASRARGLRRRCSAVAARAMGHVERADATDCSRNTGGGVPASRAGCAGAGRAPTTASMESPSRHAESSAPL
jgi:hypothetical protein